MGPTGREENHSGKLIGADVFFNWLLFVLLNNRGTHAATSTTRAKARNRDIFMKNSREVQQQEHLHLDQAAT
jgi:hypothetical protein